MNILTEEQQLRYHFEEVTSEQWGWNNFAKDSNGNYTSRIVNTAYRAFKYGVSLGKEYAN